MHELSLFTGAGGGVLGTQHLLGWRAIGYVEWDAYCQAVIKARIQDGVLHDAPVFGDIREFIASGCAAAYRGMVDVITAGFPCQPFSVAGKRRGADDERNMWPATIECIRVVRPRFALLENVPGIIATDYFGTILADLAACGFDVRWRCLSAGSLGAPHIRDRVWLLAYPANERWAIQGHSEIGTTSRNVLSHRKQQWGGWEREASRHSLGCLWWSPPPGIEWIDDGVATPLDRLRAIGNGQVPAVAATAWRLLTGDM